MIQKLTRAEVDAATVGPDVVVRDPLVPLYREGRIGRVFLRYAVTATRDRKKVSELSPLAAILPRVPPDRPLVLVPTVEETRVCLDWSAPAAMLDGTRPAVVAGYAIYRRDAGDEEYEDRPLGVALGATTYVDTTVVPDRKYAYTVRAAPVAETAAHPRPGRPTSRRCRRRTCFRRPAPDGVLVLAESGGTRLVWNPSLAGDLASYRVYRREDGAWKRIADGPQGSRLLRRRREGRTIRRDGRGQVGQRERDRDREMTRESRPSPFGALPHAFTKMSGAGNDFLVFGKRVDRGPRETEAIRRLCRRGTGVGADGVLFVFAKREGDPSSGIVADYVNADGSVGRFCGNGTRCAARYALLKGLTGPSLVVATGWGDVGATVRDDGSVALALPEPVGCGPRRAFTRHGG